MFKNYKKIHFVGAGGIGVSALAKLAILQGVKVSGSDATESETLDELRKMGAKIFVGHKKENVPAGVDLIIFSDAVPKDNPERSFIPPLDKGGRGGVVEKSYYEALGELSREKKTIAVSGTNGKSTTTAMLGKILIDAGFDPTVIVGSKIKDFKYGNLHPGKSEWLVLEACEHNAHMLNLSPECIVLTNIEADHLDFYKNLENILKSFETYVSHMPQSGFLIYNADDKNTSRVIPTSPSVIPAKAGIQAISYGEGKGADFGFANRSAGEGGQKFEFVMEGRTIGEIELKIPGMFNVYNAMAAASAAHNMGVEFDKIKKSLAEFSGLWRRFEKVGEFKGAPVISDYGHHPTAIAATILAAHEFFPGRRVVLAFEPHQHHRTQALFADFVRAFDEAEVVILSEIYNVEGRVSESDREVSSKKLADAIVKYWGTDEDTKTDREMIYCENLSETEKALRQTAKKNDVMIIMGAGDVYKVAERLCK
ncbi:MAG: UDP-N-acetylmuramate--L-alanine ligase [bacterium]